MVLPIFFQGYGISNSGVGVLISVGTLGGVLSGILAGKFSDKHGRRPLLLIGGCLYSIVFFLFAFLEKNFLTFLILRFIEGFAFFMIPVTVISMAADTFPPVQLGRAIALYAVSSGIGQLIGPIFAGYFVEASNFIVYFIFCGLFSLISVGINFFFVKETLHGNMLEPAAVAGRNNFGQIVRKFFSQIRGMGRIYMIFLAAVIIYRLGYTMVDPLFSLFLKNNLHMNMSSMSWMFAVRALCTISFAPVCGYCADKIGRKPTFLAGMALSGATMIAYSFVTSFESVLFVRILDSTSTVVLLTVIRTIIADLVRPELRGFGQGLASSISQESSTIGAIFGGVITDFFGFHGVFMTAAAGAAIALTIVYRWVPEPAKHMQRT
jgi:MFS family permease